LKKRSVFHSCYEAVQRIKTLLWKKVKKNRKKLHLTLNASIPYSIENEGVKMKKTRMRVWGAYHTVVVRCAGRKSVHTIRAFTFGRYSSKGEEKEEVTKKGGGGGQFSVWDLRRITSVSLKKKKKTKVGQKRKNVEKYQKKTRKAANGQ